MQIIDKEMMTDVLFHLIVRLPFPVGQPLGYPQNMKHSPTQEARKSQIADEPDICTA